MNHALRSHFTDPVTTDTNYTNVEQDRECNTLFWRCPDCGLAAEQESEGTTWWLFSRGMLSTVEERCRKWTRNDSWLVAITASISVSNASL